MVFEILEKHELLLKKKKCVLGVSQIEYLGHVFSVEGVSTDPSKIAAMRSWPVPLNVKQLRGFLSLTGYYRRFVKGCGVISKPLTTIL